MLFQFQYISYFNYLDLIAFRANLFLTIISSLHLFIQQAFIEHFLPSRPKVTHSGFSGKRHSPSSQVVHSLVGCDSQGSSQLQATNALLSELSREIIALKDTK